MVIGLTGGIATGKSTVSKMFSEHGIPVIDTDLIARDLLKVGTKAYDEVLEKFPVSIILTNNEISRKKLAEVIFRDKEKRDELNEPLFKKIEKGDIIKPQLNDILISKIRPYLNKTVLINDDSLYYTKAFIQIRPKVNSKLLYYCLRSVFLNKINIKT